ncbi:CapA family protein [Kiritimatiella glycovorans]|uniref:Capsule biosynthesis protein CapA n=1 Tax=Kiritimatiella glycovorans TaxID=1307763 RepID=A0A0G3EN03_9BACT|nr:CapA family protein [Kiritimatiella glycovorans]AKJ65514.1 Capsule biosynthesis protein CapA [Kiritimatiella glycovorans]
MPFSLCSVGDVMLGENTHHYRRGIPSRYNGRFDKLIAPGVLDIINTSDLLLLNFECSLMPDEQWRAASPEDSCYRAPLSALQFFGPIEVPIVANVANNHFAQHGPAAAQWTIERLRERGILVAGVDGESVVSEICGVPVRIWGASLVHDRVSSGPGNRTAAGDLLVQVKKAPVAAPNEYRIVSVHWGKEYRHLPDREQKDLSRQLHRSGVDFIAGHHPHVVQPVSAENGRVTVFSHGNFLFDQNFSRTTTRGLMIRGGPGAETAVFETRQRRHRVDALEPFSIDALGRQCAAADDPLEPNRMRVRMKLELLRSGYCFHPAVMRFFLGRLWKKGRGRARGPGRDSGGVR